MLHFNPIFPLSLCVIGFYFCKFSTAAAILDRRGRIFDAIECPGPLPSFGVPPQLPQFLTLLEMCAGRELHPGNFDCRCAGNMMTCGSSSHLLVKWFVNYCFLHCHCGPNTIFNRDDPTRELCYSSLIGPTNVGSGRSVSTPDLPANQSGTTIIWPTLPEAR